jgi:hypothetical protein
LEKFTDLPYVTDKHHIMLHQVYLVMSGRTHNFSRDRDILIIHVGSPVCIWLELKIPNKYSLLKIILLNIEKVWFMVLIVAVSFIGGGNRSTRRKPPTCRKSLTNSRRSSQLEQKLLHRNQCLQTDDDNRHRNHSVYRQMMTRDTETIMSTDR